MKIHAKRTSLVRAGMTFNPQPGLLTRLGYFFEEFSKDGMYFAKKGHALSF
jgi:hypothetical protein